MDLLQRDVPTVHTTDLAVVALTLNAAVRLEDSQLAASIAISNTYQKRAAVLGPARCTEN